MFFLRFRKRVLVTIVASLFMLGALPVSAESSSTTLDEHLKNFELREDSATKFGRFFDSARYERALSEALSGDVSHEPKRFLHVILCQYLLGKYKDGIASSQKWLAANKSAPEYSKSFVYEYIGICSVNSGEYKQAVEAFSTAKKIFATRNVDGALKNAHDLLAIEEGKVIANANQVVSQANRHLKTGIEPTLAITAHVGGYAPMYEFSPSRTFPGVGDSALWAKSVKVATEAKKLDDLGEFDKAAKLYKEALQIYDSDPSTWSAYALSTMMTSPENSDGDQVSAEILKAFQKATQLGSKDWRTWNNLAVYQLFRSNMSEAGAAFEQAIACSGVPQFQQQAIDKNLQIAKGAGVLKNYYNGLRNNLLIDQVKDLNAVPKRHK